jgi:hypothetical protein
VVAFTEYRKKIDEMKKILGIAACVAALSACTPNEIAAVTHAYGESVRGARTSEPTWSITADCAGAHVVLRGWSGVTDLAGDGTPYAILGMGNVVDVVRLDGAGNADEYHHAGPGVANTPWGWSLLINGAGVDVTGVANC